MRDRRDGGALEFNRGPALCTRHTRRTALNHFNPGNGVGLVVQRDRTVKSAAVVTFGIDVLQKVCHGDWCACRVEISFNDTNACFNDDVYHATLRPNR